MRHSASLSEKVWWLSELRIITGGLELLIGGLYLMHVIGGLQLSTGRLHIITGGIQLLTGCLHIIIGGPQLLTGGLNIITGGLKL